MRLRSTFKTLLGILGTLFIGATITMFILFPRVANDLASKLGNMGTSEQYPFEWSQAILHLVIAIVIDLLLAYFFIWRPTKRLRESFEVSGLVIRKGEGRAYIDPESVRQQVIAAIAKIGEIQRADVNIANDEGRAVIKLNIVTDISLNGPKKKNEINREVRKIVEDQLGLEIAGKPTINFTLTPEGAPVPMITSGYGNRETVNTPPPMSPPVTTRPTPPSYPEAMEPPPPVEDEPEEAPAPKKPTGIELAKNDPFAPRTSTPMPITEEPTEILPQSATVTESTAPMSGEDAVPGRIPHTEVISITDTPEPVDLPSADDLAGADMSDTGTMPPANNINNTDDRDQLASEA